MQPSTTRIQFEVQRELHQRLRDNLPHGHLRLVYESFTESLVELLENHDPAMVVAAIISKELSLDEYLKKKTGA